MLWRTLCSCIIKVCIFQRSHSWLCAGGRFVGQKAESQSIFLPYYPDNLIAPFHLRERRLRHRRNPNPACDTLCQMLGGGMDHDLAVVSDRHVSTDSFDVTDDVRREHDETVAAEL